MFTLSNPTLFPLTTRISGKLTQREHRRWRRRFQILEAPSTPFIIHLTLKRLLNYSTDIIRMIENNYGWIRTIKHWQRDNLKNTFRGSINLAATLRSLIPVSTSSSTSPSATLLRTQTKCPRWYIAHDFSIGYEKNSVRRPLILALRESIEDEARAVGYSFLRFVNISQFFRESSSRESSHSTFQRSRNSVTFAPSNGGSPGCSGRGIMLRMRQWLVQTHDNRSRFRWCWLSLSCHLKHFAAVVESVETFVAVDISGILE